MVGETDHPPRGEIERLTVGAPYSVVIGNKRNPCKIRRHRGEDSAGVGAFLEVLDSVVVRSYCLSTNSAPAFIARAAVVAERRTCELGPQEVDLLF